MNLQSKLCFVLASIVTVLWGLQLGQAFKTPEAGAGQPASAKAEFVKYAVVTADWAAGEPTWLVVEGHEMAIIPEAYKAYWADCKGGATRPLPATWSLWKKACFTGYVTRDHVDGKEYEVDWQEAERRFKMRAIEGGLLVVNRKTYDGKWITDQDRSAVYYAPTTK